MTTDPKRRLEKIEKRRGKPDEQIIIVVWTDEDTVDVNGETLTREEYLKRYPEDFETIVITWPDD